MLSSINLNDKSYEELLAEALAQIPLYTDEWTNFNVSDPGITMLQNLTAFNVLQQESISTVSDAIRRRLLSLAGYSAKENCPACILVQNPLGESLSLPAHYRLKAGSLSFETKAAISTNPWFLKAVYTGKTGDYREITRLVSTKSSSAATIFGDEPDVQNALYCILDTEPKPESELVFWAQVSGDENRAPFSGDGTDPKFSEISWQYYTENGWQDMDFYDGTCCFLTDGEIRLRFGSAPAALFPETDVYGPAIRCRLISHEYDVPPRLKSLSGNLFPMFQQTTSAAVFSLFGDDSVSLCSSLAALGNIFVYCREEQGGDYLPYAEAPERFRGGGRFYTLSILEDGVQINFDLERFGFAPFASEDSVLICCYDNEMLHHRALGPVYGYDNQEISLEHVSGLVPQELALLVQLPSHEEGEAPRFRLVRPDSEDKDEICYSVLSEEGKILIRRPTYDGICSLFLAQCVTTHGQAGNLRSGAVLQLLGGYDGTETIREFFVPSNGFGGQSFETAEQLRLRFTSDMRGSGSAVTAADYEALAKSASGLCIHKVKAVVFPKENLVKLVVKPYTDKRRPELSPLYIRQLSAHMEKRRMLTTRIELISPRYVRIDLDAKIFVKPHFEKAREEIINLLQSLLDYETSDVPFGSWVRFGEIYGALSRLPCVLRVDSLRLKPEDRQNLTVVSSDFKLADNALCYPGEINLELSNLVSKNR
ncbi:MAG: hypothetical protein GX025_07205 [Clostridiales bacterium]|nr:hypothetical protein [Clostridiales bacterium]